MTLIATYINKFGIIHISDSNLSTSKGNAGFGQKVFPVPNLNSALSYSGSYSVNGETIDKWMNNFILSTYAYSKSIEEFTENLSRKLTSEMRDYEIAQPTIIHIAGYSKGELFSHVEFWHISNTGLQDDGEYSVGKSEFNFENDFNSLKNPKDEENLAGFDKHPLLNQWFINGFPPGRITHQYLKQKLDPFLAEIWKIDGWKFREPRNIFESAEIIKTYFQLLIKLFVMSDYPAMYIGGEIQTHLIPAPPDLRKTKNL